MCVCTDRVLGGFGRSAHTSSINRSGDHHDPVAATRCNKKRVGMPGRTRTSRPSTVTAKDPSTATCSCIVPSATPPHREPTVVARPPSGLIRPDLATA